MIITLEKYTSDFYETAVSWWVAHKWAPVPESALPTIGLVSFADGEPVAVAWLYQTDSTFSILEWMVSNPDYKNKEMRGKAIDSLIFALVNAAKNLGFTHIYTSTKAGKYMKRLQDQGFNLTESNMNNLISVV